MNNNLIKTATKLFAITLKVAALEAQAKALKTELLPVEGTTYTVAVGDVTGKVMTTSTTEDRSKGTFVANVNQDRFFNLTPKQQAKLVKLGLIEVEECVTKGRAATVKVSVDAQKATVAPNKNKIAA